MFGVYVHIPYCRTRCPYCDFVSEAVAGAPPDAYLDALCAEINAFQGPVRADTLFVGGGTPSLLSPAGLERLMEALRVRFSFSPDAEITMEANPDDITPELPEQWRALGVNRVSLGVQSLDDRVLRHLGRRHDADGARRAAAHVAAVFENWNMDLIFGGRPADAWTATLREAVSMRPAHVAAYGLTHEPGTPFGGRTGEALDDDALLALYQEAEAALAGYDHYEISNYALRGRECRHNLIYWQNREYAGFGTGAYSFVDGVRARNLPDSCEYMRRPGEKGEALALDAHEIRLETVIQHMRLRRGLSRRNYLDRFGVPVDADFGAALDALARRGLLVNDGDMVRPTAEGFYLNNEIGLALVG